MIIEPRHPHIDPEMVLIWIGIPSAFWILIVAILYRVLS
jgi:hypothetical protein